MVTTNNVHEKYFSKFNKRHSFTDKFREETAKIGYALLWLIGIPLPIVIILYLIFGE